MNKLKFIFPVLLSVLLIAVACEPVQNSYVVDSYSVDVYMVNGNATLTPELGDTILRVSNFSSYDLEPGDRACICLHYHFDAYNSKNCELKIADVMEKIETLELDPRENTADESYDLPIGVYDYNLCKPYAWVCNNRVNVNALFKAKPAATDFVMSLAGVKQDTLLLNLRAKTTAPSDTAFTKLLSYSLDGIGNMLTDEEKAGLQGHEKLKLRVQMKDGWIDVSTGEFVNPLR